MSNNKRNVCLMFSGGYDSTYLLLKIIEQKVSNKIDNVSLIMVDSTLFPNNTIQYDNARKIIEELKKEYGCVNSFNIKTIKIEKNFKCIDRVQYGQMAFILGCAMMGVEDDTELWFGFLEKDTLLGSRKRKEAVENIISGMANFIDYKNITLKNPLLDEKFKYCHDREIKAMIIDKLLEYPNILNLCFSCESVYHDKTEKCENCNKHFELKSALDILLVRYTDELFRKTIYGPSEETKTKFDVLKKIYNEQFPKFVDSIRYIYPIENTSSC